MKKISSILLASLLMFSCVSKNTNNDSSKYYSVIVNHSNISNSEILIENLTQSISDTLIVGDSSFTIGLFDTYRKACDRGFELFADSLIPNFNVVFQDSIISNDYTHFYFIGRDLDRPALYKTDILNIDPQLVWSKWGRKILKLYRSDERENFFFSTALHETIRGGFPLIMDTRLYRFNRSSEQIALVERLGHVMDVKGNWESDSTFLSYFSVLDTMVSSNIIQYEHVYDNTGTLIDSIERIFELITDGIPIPKFSTIDQISPDHRYKMTTVLEDSIKKINIIDELNGTNNIITELNGEIKESRWNTNSDFLFLTTKSTIDSTDLLVINLREMKVTKHFSGNGEKNFLVIGNLLIFDDSYNVSSFITLFRYRRNMVYSRIDVAGGCGINSIPQEIKTF